MPAQRAGLSGNGSAPVILHVFRYFRPDFTGEGIYVEKLAPLLEARGIGSDVVVAATLAPASVPRLAGIGAIRYFGRRRRDPPTPNLRLLLWVAWHGRRYPVVHLHAMVDRLFLVPILARLLGCKVIQSCTLDDGLGRVIDSYRGWRRPVARRLVRALHAVVAISPRLAEDSWRAMPSGQVHLIPQGVVLPAPAAEPRAALRGRLGLEPDAPVLLFVGSLSRRKGIDTLLALVRDLPAASRARLVIVGPDLEDDYAAEMRAAAGPRVQFVGYLDDPSPWYRAADMFVFASHAEGFGNVLLEAMAHGLPVVSRRLPGVTDAFIEDGRTGLLFDGDAGLREAVLGLLADPARAGAIGAAAAAAVRAGYALPAIADRYAALYKG